MTPVINPLPYRKVHRALLRLGFRVDRQVGGHVVHVHPDGRLMSVPRHDREEISPGFMRRLLKDAKIDADDFVDAL